MHRQLIIPVAMLLAATALVPAVTAAPVGPVGRYIVVLRDDVDAPAVAREHAARFGAEVGFVYTAAIEGYSAAIPEARLAQLRSDPRVALISEDREVQTTAETIPTGISRSLAPAGTGVTAMNYATAGFAVAVIDTGIDLTHPDLNVVGGKNCATGSTYNDGNGHGSHVSGTIGARQNTVGVVGVAPGIPLLAVRVLNNNGSGTWSGVICGVDWVTANQKGSAATGGRPILVASMSLGGSGSDGACGSDALHKAICNSTNAGVLYVVAAGNNGANFSNFVPATYDQVLTVSAMADFNGQPGGGAKATCRSDVDDTSADFSNYATAGSTDASHTIAAPGVCILSTWKGGGYSTISGTSMATPHVSGAAALCIVKATCAGMSPSQLRSRLLGDALTGSFSSPSNRAFGKMLDASY